MRDFLAFSCLLPSLNKVFTKVLLVASVNKVFTEILLVFVTSDCTFVFAFSFPFSSNLAIF